MKIVSRKNDDGKMLSVVESGYVTEVRSYDVKRNRHGVLSLSVSIEEFCETKTKYRELYAEDETYLTQWVDVVSITSLGEHFNDSENCSYLVIYKVSYRWEVESMEDYLKRIAGVNQ